MRIEFVSQTVDRADIIGASGVADLTAKVFHVLVDEIEISQVVRIVAPEMGGDRLTGEHPVLIDHEIQQQIEFLGGGIQDGVRHAGLEGVGIQADLVKLNDISTSQVFSPVYRPDAGM